MSLNELTVSFGKETIPVKLELRDKKDLSITVKPDRSVVVRAPQCRDIKTIVKRIQKKAWWIAKQREYFEQIVPVASDKRYISGETFLYLGRQYRLKLHDDTHETVKLIGRYLHVFTKGSPNAARIKELLDHWYLEHAKAVFSDKLEKCKADSPLLRQHAPSILVRKMDKRWGSYNSSGRILLNVELVKTPLSCIEYVITHELCHLSVPNHSAKFFNMLQRCCPEWERCKARLERFVI